MTRRLKLVDRQRLPLGQRQDLAEPVSQRGEIGSGTAARRPVRAQGADPHARSLIHAREARLAEPGPAGRRAREIEAPVMQEVMEAILTVRRAQSDAMRLVNVMDRGGNGLAPAQQVGARRFVQLPLLRLGPHQRVKAVHPRVTSCGDHSRQEPIDDPRDRGLHAQRIPAGGLSNPKPVHAGPST